MGMQAKHPTVGTVMLPPSQTSSLRAICTNKTEINQEPDLSSLQFGPRQPCSTLFAILQKALQDNHVQHTMILPSHFYRDVTHHTPLCLFFFFSF